MCVMHMRFFFIYTGRNLANNTYGHTILYSSIKKEYTFQTANKTSYLF